MIFRSIAQAIFGAPRSGQWPRVRREHLEKHPACAACGRGRDIEVHHIEAFSDHPERECDHSNLISLCADPCHFVHGHLMSWHRINPSVVDDCRRYIAKIKNAQRDT
jgi:5-methylcytosine-specific restriction endonuclease McrA